MGRNLRNSAFRAKTTFTEISRSPTTVGEIQVTLPVVLRQGVAAAAEMVADGAGHGMLGRGHFGGGQAVGA